MSEPRTYVVGLPVVVTVHDDGHIEYAVDFGDTTKAIGEDADADERYGEEQVAADRVLIDATLEGMDGDDARGEVWR